MSSCSRTCVSTPKKRRTIRGLRKALAKLCDVYVDDAFAVAHRGHASNVGITEFVKTCAVGLLLESELDYLKKATETPVRPLVAIIGGAKVSDKIGVLEKLIEKVDKLLIGGGMAFTFLKALGNEVGKSLCERRCSMLRGPSWTRREAGTSGSTCPLTVSSRKRRSADAVTKCVPVAEIPKEWMALDIGPAFDYALRRSPGRRQDDRLERPYGHVRARSLQQGTYGLVTLSRPPRPDHRGRRGYGHGRTPGRGGTQDFLYIDRRRRLPRAARREDHAGGRGARDLRRPTMRRWMLAGNWKMHNTIGESRPSPGPIVEGSKGGVKGGEIVVAPVFTALAAVSEVIKGSPVARGGAGCVQRRKRGLYG